MGETLQAGIAQIRQQLAALDDSPASREFARRHRLTAKQLGRPPADPGEQRALTLRCLEQSREVIRISRCLQEHGIRHAFIKGIPLSMLAWGCVDARFSKDIDLLIDQADMLRALELLRQPAFGYSAEEELCGFTPRQTAFYFRTRHHYCLRRGDTVLELHWRVMDSRFILPDLLSDENLQTVELSGKPVLTLTNEALLVYLCAHGSEHAWFRLKWLFDIPALMDHRGLDWNKVWGIAQTGGCLHQLALGVWLSEQIFDLETPEALAEPCHRIALPERIKRFVIEAMLGPEENGAGSAPLRVRFRFAQYSTYFFTTRYQYFELLEQYGTKSVDWAVLRLPDRFFLLYFVLRPFLLIYRRFLRRQ